METINISQLESTYNSKLFGYLPNGENISVLELTNKSGIKLAITDYGATIVGLKIPVFNGNEIDVVLGFDNLEDYIKSFDLQSPPYFGATVGRYAGRIKNGVFNLNGNTFQLNKNNGDNSLHGGNVGFSQKKWTIKKVNYSENPSVTFTYLSNDLEEQFPGALSIEMTYTLTEENELKIEYFANATEDTIINLTHHSYFNLDGHQSTILNQKLAIDAEQMLETNNENIPTGRFIDLKNNNFDYSNLRNCPSKIDNTFVLRKNNECVASLYSSKNNLKMDVFTNQPALHIYVGGNCFGEIKGKENADYHPTSGICFETQNFPDAPNHKHFPNSVLKKGETYHHKTIYQFKKY